ncbi:MAG: formyltetrahydrofolate deformylase [Phycisphaerales bacterium]|nr:formyltetrahydrofolate deformylase [Phycisphaerales bacterium]|tara:strand:- start:30187 stop:31068 length:882 start_codon:yes stop_codon:yes gene_type:complete
MSTDPSSVDVPTEAVVLVSSPDRPGIVARLTATLDEVGGNILEASQYTDIKGRTFLQRVHVSWPSLNPEPEEVHDALQELADQFQMDWRIHWGHARRKVAVFVSREDHCLHDLLLLQRDGSLQCQISLIISNHPDLEQVAERFDVPFHHVEVDESGDSKSESRQLSLLEANDIDLVVLAKYMRVLSPVFVERYPGRIINIHHSFLPAFAGGRPYHQAHEKGVKLIGATAHYATAELDAGPIIEQGVIRVTHKDSVADMVRKGRDIERTVLARAVRWHLEDRVVIHAGRAVVFA